MKKRVDTYIKKLHKWKEELTILRRILLECGLNEGFDLMLPSYSIDGKNIVLLHEFKDFCGMLFEKGALLEDPNCMLVQQTEDAQFERQLRFYSTTHITELENTLKDYIYEAIALEIEDHTEEQIPLVVLPKKTLTFEIPEELAVKFQENPTFEKAFINLSEDQQKNYLYYFSEPKQSRTKIVRIEKKVDRILKGLGLTD